MTTGAQRDLDLERLLRRGTGASGSPTPSCLDAEAAAAWVDGSLDAHARGIVDPHVANCARCQALLSTIVRTAPAPGDTAQSAAPWWRGWWVRWMAPTALAAAAVSVWFLLPTERTLRPPASPGPQAGLDAGTAARNETLDESAPARLDDAAPRIEEERQAPPRAESRAPASPAQATVANETAEDRPRKNDVAGTGTAAMGEKVAFDAVGGSAQQARDAAEAAAPPAVARAKEAAAPVPGAAVGAVVSAEREQALARPVERREAAAATSDLAASPDGRHRWRRSARGADYSPDGGDTWLPTDVPRTIVAASAPAGASCWAIEPDGGAFVTTDGVAWRRVSVPARMSLVRIEALDAASATVTTSDGRRIVTRDGGATWTLR